MTAITLEQCLSCNAQILGPEYANLGTTEQTGWLNRKILLAFDKEKGWSVVKLNWIQLFLRNFLGFYTNTHLANIIRARKLSGYKNPALKEILEAHFFSPKRNFVSMGNAQRSDAQVFLFPENHLDENYKKTSSRYINAQYQAGDVVLIEGLAAGETISELKHLKKGIQIFGWEPKNFKELTKCSADRKQKEMEDKFNDLLKITDFKFPDDWKIFQEIVDYIDPSTGSVEKLIKKIELESKSASDPHIYFQNRVVKFLMGLYKKMHYAWYHHVSSEDRTIAENSIAERNHSLAKEILHYRLLGKRVFVTAGSLHLLCGSSLKELHRLEEIHLCLREQKFVILAGKNDLTDKRIRFLKESFPHLKKVEP